METVYSPEAREELKNVSEKAREAIKQSVEELKQDPTGHENSKIIRAAGRAIYRLKVKEERSGEPDHRVIYDIENGKIRIYSIIDRDEGYDKDEISERLNR